MMNTQFQSFGLIVGMVLLASGCVSTGSSVSKKDTLPKFKEGIYTCTLPSGTSTDMKLKKVNNQKIQFGSNNTDATPDLLNFDKKLGKFVTEKGDGYLTVKSNSQLEFSWSWNNVSLDCHVKK